jgi:hypothetical protein
MNRRGKIVGASVLAVIGVVLMATDFLGGSNLQAASVGSTGTDYAKLFIWIGVVALVISALLFISASAE